MPKRKKDDLPQEFIHIWSEMSSERMRALMNELRLWIRHRESDERMGAYRALRDSFHYGSSCKYHGVGRIEEGTVCGITENRITLRLKNGEAKSIPISKLFIEDAVDA